MSNTLRPRSSEDARLGIEHARMRTALGDIAAYIQWFDADCNASSGTDIDAAWSLFYRIRRRALAASRPIPARRPGRKQSTR